MDEIAEAVLRILAGLAREVLSFTEVEAALDREGLAELSRADFDRALSEVLDRAPGRGA